MKKNMTVSIVSSRDIITLTPLLMEISIEKAKINPSFPIVREYILLTTAIGVADGLLLW